jgi:hypothetical protein
MRTVKFTPTDTQAKPVEEDEKDEQYTVKPRPGRENRFVGKEGDIHVTGYLPVKPWLGRDGKVYPEHMRDTVKPEDVEQEDPNAD